MPPKKDRKRQTKLSFSPISDQSKHAHVSYGNSNAKRRRVEEWMRPDFAHSEGPSSSALARESVQTSPLTSSVDVRPRASNVIEYYGDDDQGINGDARGVVLSSSSSDELIDKVSRKKAHKGKRKERLESSQMFSLPPGSARASKIMRDGSSRKQPNAIDISSDEDTEPSEEASSDDAEVAPVTPVRKITTPKTLTTKNPVYDDSSDEDVVNPSTQRSTRRHKKELSNNLITDKDEEDEDDDDDDDDIRPSTQRPSRKSATTTIQSLNTPEKALNSRRRLRSSHPVPVEYDDEDEDEDDEEVVTPASRSARSEKVKTRRSNRRSEQSSEQEDGSDESVDPSSRRKRRSTDSDERDEIDQDVEDLKVSTVFRDDSQSTRKLSKADQRRQRLEELKARRTGNPSSPVNNESDYKEMDDEDALVDEAGYEDEEDEMDRFVEEDDGDGELDLDQDGEGMDSLRQLRHRQKKLKDHWEYVVESMLQRRLNPGGTAEREPYFRVSLDRVDKECRGKIDMLVSSAWVPAFTNALKARPDYSEAPLGSDFDEFDPGKCSACNRDKHPPRFVVRLTGKAYDSATLEPLKDVDEEDEDSFDEEGRRLIDEDREFRLGTFCRSNAMNAHAMIHWRKGLKDWIHIYLKQNGYLKSRRITERDGWTSAKRSKLAEDITSELKADGTMRQLWIQFEEKLGNAHNIQGQRYWR